MARARHCIEPRLFCLLLSGAFGLMEIKHFITSFPRRLTVSVIRTTIGTIQKCDGTTTVNRFVVRCTTSVYTYLARTRSPLVSSNITGIIADNKKTQCQFSAKFSQVFIVKSLSSLTVPGNEANRTTNSKTNLPVRPMKNRSL